MDDLNAKVPLFKKLDQQVFEALEKFKQTPNYTPVQDFYNGLEEDQQKLFKVFVLAALAVLPVLLLTTMVWTNSAKKSDLELRTSIVRRSNEILGQNQGIRDVAPQILSENPIDSGSMMTSRVSNLLSSMAIDLTKIQVKDYNSNMISSNVMRSEADFSFTNVSTEQLMNIFTGLITREKFRIESVNISRNADTNLLQGTFHAIHFSSVSQTEEGE